MMRDEIILHEEQQFVGARRHLRAIEHRQIGASVDIGHDRLDERVLAFDFPKFDAHAGGGAAGDEIEDVGAKFCGHKSGLTTDHADVADKTTRAIRVIRG